MHLLHILAAIDSNLRIQEPLCGAWRRPTQVSQGHLSVAVAVHEPLCCALIRGLHARATPLWARRSQQQPHRTPPALPGLGLENRASAGVWRSVAKPAID
jgi:hypothetical protein